QKDLRMTKPTLTMRTWRIGRVLVPATTAACLTFSCTADRTSGSDEPTGQSFQAVTGSACLTSVTENTMNTPTIYDGYITFKNTGTTTMTNPTVNITIPAGDGCTSVDAPWHVTSSSGACSFTATGVSVAPNASLRFHYVSDHHNFNSASAVSVTDP